MWYHYYGHECARVCASRLRSRPCFGSRPSSDYKVQIGDAVADFTIRVQAYSDLRVARTRPAGPARHRRSQHSSTASALAERIAGAPARNRGHLHGRSDRAVQGEAAGADEPHDMRGSWRRQPGRSRFRSTADIPSTSRRRRCRPTCYPCCRAWPTTSNIGSWEATSSCWISERGW